jgi:transcriptional regulator with XRE-family HTH domain
MTDQQRYDQLRKQVAERVTAILVEKGWTLSHFADILGKSKSHVSSILNAKANLTLRVIAQLERALGEQILKVNLR